MKIDYTYIGSPEGQKKYEDALFSILNDFSGVSGMLSLLGPMFGNALGIIANIVLIVKFNIGIAAVLVVTSEVHVMVACRRGCRTPSIKQCRYVWGIAKKAPNIIPGYILRTVPCLRFGT